MKFAQWLGVAFLVAGLVLMLLFTSPLGLGLILIGAPLLFFTATVKALRKAEREGKH